MEIELDTDCWELTSERPVKKQGAESENPRVIKPAQPSQKTGTADSENQNGRVGKPDTTSQKTPGMLSRITARPIRTTPRPSRKTAGPVLENPRPTWLSSGARETLNPAT